MAWTTVVGRVVPGHGVASGIANDPRFPEGTLAMQKPFFLERGLNLSGFHQGTLNLSIAPSRYTICKPVHTFCEMKWSPDLPAENFSFFDCRLSKHNEDEAMEGLVYYPHPETKPEFFQDPSTLEILAPFVSGVEAGKRLHIQLKRSQMVVT